MSARLEKMLNSQSKCSISIEACLTLVPLLLLLLSFALIIYADLLLLNLAYALENTAEEASLIFTLADYVGNHLPEPVEKAFSRIISKGDFHAWEELAIDYASSLVLAPWLEQRIDYWLENLRSEGGFALPAHERQIYLEWDEAGNCLLVTLYVKFNTLFGPYEREIPAAVALWSNHQAGCEDKNQEHREEEDDNVWSESNFHRGKFFREKAGANLPFNYPVICYYQAGVAKSVRSIDPNAPSYQDPTKARKSILRDLDRLADFESYSGRPGKHPAIDPGSIRHKSYILYVPKNLPETYQASFFTEIRAEAAARGLELDLRPFAHSRRYQENDSID
ncbi:MAG: hypothetical protein Q4E09_02525 [Eubacteriales bacterium]|nr:hypothetical protein [Eubacteriales bacterium]